MLYSFEITLEDSDYVNFNIHNAKVYDIFKRQVLFLRILFAAALLLFSVMEILKNDVLFENVLFSVFIFIFLVIFELFIPRLFLALTRVQVIRFIRKGRAPYSRSSHIEFFEDGFTEITEHANMQLKYSSIEKLSFDEVTKTLYLHFNKASATIVPRSAFATPEEMVDFLIFIKGKCVDAECLF